MPDFYTTDIPGLFLIVPDFAQNETVAEIAYMLNAHSRHPCATATKPGINRAYPHGYVTVQWPVEKAALTHFSKYFDVDLSALNNLVKTVTSPLN